MPRVFRDANVCSAIPLFEMPCGASWATLSSVGVRDPTPVSTNRVVARQLLPDVSFRSGGSAPIRQVHSDSQLSAGLDALICVPKPAAQAGVSARQFKRCLGALQHGDGFPERSKRLFAGLGQCPAT